MKKHCLSFSVMLVCLLGCGIVAAQEQKLKSEDVIARHLAALAQEAPQVIPLWQNGAPGFESKRNEPEQAKDYWVRNIHNPSVVAFNSTDGDANATDAIDRVSARPNYLVMIYPGPGGIPETIPANAPPAFLLVANDDTCCSGPVMKLLQGYRAAKLPVEAHIFAKGSHAFNMGNRSKL